VDAPIRTDEVVAGLANISSNLESLNLLVRHLTNKRHPFARMKATQLVAVSLVRIRTRLPQCARMQQLLRLHSKALGRTLVRNLTNV
jgi:hypothetical protein